ncbi:uncharacterized protein LOC134538809 [Bacillus rossius redtenbacheri]|uniref:uncharacterized protein LOC134538809 n=1 Tax=Bacillus rossius redtenbacheri TaxID=93214 RepID=UPI002FDCE1CF
MNCLLKSAVIAHAIATLNGLSSKRLHQHPSDVSSEQIFLTETLTRIFFENRTYLLVICTEYTQDYTGIDSFIFKIHDGFIAPLLIVQNLTEETHYHQFAVTDTTENSVGFVYFIESLTEKCFVEPKWLRAAIWSSRAIFVLVVKEEALNVSSQVHQMLRDCWESYNILNAVVICRTQSTTYPDDISGTKNLFSAFTYNPFLGTGNGEIVTLPVDKSSIDALVRKLYDCNGHVFNYTSAKYHPMLQYKTDPSGKLQLAGPDGIIDGIVVRKLNGSVNALPESRAFFRNDETHNKLLIANEYLLMHFVRRYAVYPHDQACVTFVVPKSEQVPAYLGVVMPFTAGTWGAYWGTSALLGTVWLGVAGTSPMDAVSLVLWGSTLRRPVRLAQRLVVWWCLVHSLVMTSCYQGSLGSYLSTAHFYPDMSSAQELLLSSWPISIAMDDEETKDMFDQTEFDEQTLQLAEKLMVIIDDDEAFRMLSRHRNVSRVYFRTPAERQVSRPEYRRDGLPLMHVLEGCLFKFPLAFIGRSTSNPFLHRINAVVQRLSEAGVLAKVRRDYLDEPLRNTTLGKTRTLKILTLNYLLIPFALLGVGLLLGMLAAVLEFIVNSFHML